VEPVVRVLFGSHLYGTNTPTSDMDYKAVHVPDARSILLQNVQDSVHNFRPKAEGQKNEPGDVDEESYSLQRYLKLLADGQTVAIDMLFAPDSCLLHKSELWDYIRKNKGRLLTKKSVAFVGYCRTQANKYGIKGSRVKAVADAANIFQTWSNQLRPGAKVSEIATVLEGLIGDHTRIVVKETTPGRTETYFDCCNRLVGFNNTLKEAATIYSRIYDNYGARARQAQDNEGIDWKALSHAVRVGQEAIELLTTRNVTFPLPNAAHILDIKQGKLPYQQVAEEIEQLLVDVEVASAASDLPDNVDREFIDDLVCREHLRMTKRVFLPSRRSEFELVSD
jgi:hypothetical protein